MPGSSPRVRGKLFWLHRDVIGPGLIPACAGKTLPVRAAKTKARAHPRVCGENSADHSKNAMLAGSSPRVRGKHAYLNSYRVVHGLIPACAGKTVDFTKDSVYRGAHPRVCGENRT